MLAKSCVALLASPPIIGLSSFCRRKLDRFNCGILPRTRVDRLVHNYSAISKHAPPRVCAALLRTAWNGWITGRRFQQHGITCIFGCQAEDSIEHYALCPAIHKLAASKFGLPRPPSQQACLASFLGLEPRATTNSLEMLCRRAKLTAAVYLTHCWARHTAPQPTGANLHVALQMYLELGGTDISDE